MTIPDSLSRLLANPVVQRAWLRSLGGFSEYELHRMVPDHPDSDVPAACNDELSGLHCILPPHGPDVAHHAPTVPSDPKSNTIEWGGPPDPEAVNTGISELKDRLLERHWKHKGGDVEVNWDALATLAYELGARVR